MKKNFVSPFLISVFQVLVSGCMTVDSWKPCGEREWPDGCSDTVYPSGEILSETGGEATDSNDTGNSSDVDGDAWTTEDGDCNDADASVHPGADELCNEVDDNCDELIDNDPVDPGTWYSDGDSDTFGDEAFSVTACDPPDGYVADNTDCNDTNPDIHPGASETDCTDPIDYNCDGSVGSDDLDADEYRTCEDCDDSNEWINPSAAEFCDSIDNNCNGLTDSDDPGVVGESLWYADADADTFGNPDSSIEACGAPEGYVVDSTDCDDDNDRAFPGATEYCNGFDDDCDGETDEPSAVDALTLYDDDDGDGFGDDISGSFRACPADGFVETNGDCDDTNVRVNPAETESCNSVDDNCNGEIDEGVKNTYYRDVDADNYGDVSDSIEACEAPSDYVTDLTDCNDADALVHPGADESCNEVDDDCDDEVDEDAVDAVILYVDVDSDGYGGSVSIISCDRKVVGYSSSNTDCDDTDSSIHPGAEEICNEGDDNCEGRIDEGVKIVFYADTDSDSYGDNAVSVEECEAPENYVENNSDCNDTDASVHPGADESCNEVDDNCEGRIDEGVTSTFYADYDEDSYGNATSTAEACSVPEGYVTDLTDCNDADASVHPGADEYCKGGDKNCDGTLDDALDAFVWYIDADDDDYGDDTTEVVACTLPGDEYTVSIGGDCDDDSDGIYPGAEEICGDGIDNDCDSETPDGRVTTWYRDSDGDGFGNASTTTVRCGTPKGYVADNTDCDDTDFDIHPGAEEVCNESDDDCDGTADEDLADYEFFYDGDSDGYGDATSIATACEAPDGYIDDNTDCDDADADIYPGAPELCDDSDNDCDGVSDEGWNCEDVDGDGILNRDDLVDIIDANGDGHTDACIPGFLVFDDPYSTAAAYLQINESAYGLPYTTLRSSRALNGDVDEDGVMDAWCIFASDLFRTTHGNEAFRFVSSLSVADPSDPASLKCADWAIPNFVSYCASFGGKCCQYDTTWDGCGHVGWTPYVHSNGSDLSCP